MRLTTLLVAVAMCAPGLANAQARKKTTTKTTTTTTTTRPAPAAAPAEAPRHHRDNHMSNSMEGAYGTAGCGLGSIAFHAKPGFIQVVAATLNGIGGNQTFGISTGTSNCDIPHSGQQAAVFIEVNREILAKDAARGQGETIEGLASILGCDDSAALGQALQSNFDGVFAKENDSYGTTRAIINAIKSNAQLQSTCHVG
jgi:hypothetical protein